MTIGQRVREAREALGWSQSRLADELDTTKSWISRIEHGQKPSKARMKLLTHVLKDEADRRATEKTASERQVRRLRALRIRIQECIDAWES